MAANGEPATPRHPQDDDERTRDDEPASETSPLLPPNQAENNDQSQPPRGAAATLLRSLSHSKGGKRRWPSLIALLLLCIVAVLIIVFAFVAPSAVESYAQQAVVFEPTSLSIDSFLDDGVRARVQGDFKMDSSRVEKKSVRDLGKLCTWIASEVETGTSEMEVSLPEYGNVVLGTAQIPPIKVSIRDGHATKVDFLSDLQPGDVDGIRRIANDWMDGRLGQLRVVGKAQVPLKSGIISLGKQMVQQEMLFANDDIPSMPGYKIKKLNVREVDIPSGKGMAADVSLKVENEYPVEFTVPPLGFGILVDNCEKSDDLIMVADALTQEIAILPKADVEVNVTGTVRHLPSVLTQACPGSTKSPLDILLGRYIHGEENTVYVRGSDAPSLDTPRWVSDLMADITVPVPLPGRTFGHLVRNFSLTNTHFSLPDPLAEPGTPEGNPRISANVRAIVALPEEMNFNISVGKVRADADVFYKGKKLGRLDLSKWQDANSTRIDSTPEEGPALAVESEVKDAPLEIQDEDVFTDVIQELIFGKRTVIMKIQAEVDAGVETALGEFAINRIPADGQVPIKPISRPHEPGKKPTDPPSKLPSNITNGVNPKLVDLSILNTTETSLLIGGKVNITNPTAYSATIPYVDIHIMKNGSLLGHATAYNLSIHPGNNSYLSVEATYDPLTLGGPKAKAIGRELISQYISGWNTTITLQMHEESFPGNPTLGRALSKFPVEVAAPHLSAPKRPDDGDDDEDPDDEDDKATHFIKDATMHLLTSTASFTLLSPLHHSTLYITHLNATAIYHSDDVGLILYDEPFGVPPVEETPGGEGFETPRLPVEWSLGSVGYGAVKRALGGTLRLAARAEVGVRLGRWREEIWFRGGGLGVRIRL
ncbi:hypothetical protein M409DRAFT_66480 [Zasmidium cellare ATCC 36951]|uniref:Pre-rRNA processing protein n=1 Tax=Zasmidium cellare ATCC 36951 TaxID=1080233 RepID=A0A6A6CIW1_ZASCE|nr:uncharacterized protein M409DRAFT_66480 [Zasmidium cellare ATCC 36951]KAF2166981.1 hypothetical protein M409DRAFT_66480 [Zasmidium cellare ATCC 36951]